MSRPDRILARRRWAERRKALRRAMRGEQVLMRERNPRAALNVDLAAPAGLREAWRRWMVRFGRVAWGAIRNANGRPTARPRLRPTRAQVQARRDLARQTRVRTIGVG